MTVASTVTMKTLLVQLGLNNTKEIMKYNHGNKEKTGIAT
jgi:hypothetical protein